MKKVFLDGLPKRGQGKGITINWVNAIGHSVKFVYDDIIDEVKIIDFYRNSVKHVSYLKVEYKNYIYDIPTSDFKRCGIGRLLGTYTGDYKYKINDVIINSRLGKLKILEQLKIGKRNLKGYKYECLICGNIDTISEYNLNHQNGCNVCVGKKVLKGYNDLWTTRPDIAKLLKYPEHGYEINQGKNKRELFMCPNCNFERNLVINDVTTYGFYCSRCGDGNSYPEKFLLNVLEQLLLNFEKEVVFKWSQNKRYDFFIPSLNCIIEIHGAQHYCDSFESYRNTARSLKEEQENDIFKKELAINNKINKYIVIDASESKLDYIKNNILDSDLAKILNLSNINWLECHEFATNNLVKIVCDLWDKEQMNITSISKKLYLSTNCITNYLKQGAVLGWCKYIPRIAGINDKIKVICLNTKEIFESLKEASITYNTNDTSISGVCKDKRKFSGKHPKTGEYLQWQYYNDYLINPKKLLKNEDINNLNRGGNKYNSRSVICLNTMKIFNSQKEASYYYNTSQNNICLCCQKKQKSSGKHPETGEKLKWMYYEDWEKQQSKVS